MKTSCLNKANTAILLRISLSYTSPSFYPNRKHSSYAMPNMDAAAARFFSAPHFAVVGASQDTSKFGYRILAWYHTHSLDVTPINPRSPTINLPSKAYSTVKSVSELLAPSETALSFLTPPAATKTVLEEAKAAGISSVWLQPGSFDDSILSWAKANFKSAVGGYEGGTRGGEGWCVLVDGEDALKATGRTWKQQKL
jgi:predicted CoA-binding protein